jgi:hypothetical protein
VVIPASEKGGVIVQRIEITESLYGKVTDRKVGWEAWEVAPGDASTGLDYDDVWRSPRAPSKPWPAVATTRVVTGEARFYEGISMDDLGKKHGFRVGGSGFSDKLPSTNSEPQLPPDRAGPPLTRTKTYTKW